MTQRVLKFPIGVLGVSELWAPKGMESLSAQLQNDKAVLWALADTDATMVSYEVALVYTGDPMPAGLDWEFVDTIQTEIGLVLHVFVHPN